MQDKPSNLEELSFLSVKCSLMVKFKLPLLTVSTSSIWMVRFLSTGPLSKNKMKKSDRAKFVWKKLKMRKTFCSIPANVLDPVALFTWIVCFSGSASRSRKRLLEGLFITILKNLNVKCAEQNCQSGSRQRRIRRLSCFPLRSLKATISFLKGLVRRQKVSWWFKIFLLMASS